MLLDLPRLDPSATSTRRPVPRRAVDARYRPFFLAGLGVALTLGAGWGAYLLWSIGRHGAFTSVPVHAVNAHGLAQVYGWVGLFVLGFAYQFFPKLLHAPLAAPRLARVVFATMVAGILAATLGLDLAGSVPWARPLGLAGGVAITVAATIFAGQMAITFRRSGRALEPWSAFAGAGIACLVASTVASTAHAWVTTGAADRDTLVGLIGTWQAPLRDLQIHGLALFMILGVSLKLLPSLLQVAPAPARRAWAALAILVPSLLAEAGFFLAYRASGHHVFAALLLLPWLGLLAGSAMVSWTWRPWRAVRDGDRTTKFFRAAYGWLFVSLAMLLLLPAYQVVSGIEFSHAYYGATRHAITVGFVSLMIMGMSARFVPALHGHDRFRLPRLAGPFVLVNLGCLLRCTLQILTDWHAAGFALVGVSSVLELAGIAWWGASLVRTMRAPRAA